jgi:hypothetical protein
MAAAALPAAPAIAKAMAPVPAVAPVVAVPIAATVEEVPFLDAKLMQLVDDYLSANDERQRLEEMLHRAAEAQEAKHPMPDALRVRPEDAELELPDHNGASAPITTTGCGSTRFVGRNGKGSLSLRRCIHEGFDPPPAARARADGIVAACDKWWPKLHRRIAGGIEPPYPRGSGGIAMEKQRKRLEALLSRLEAKINKTRARTVVGILGEAKVASLAAPDPDDDPAISSFLRDTVAMAETYLPYGKRVQS